MEDKIEADGGVDIPHKLGELRHRRELRPDVCRLAIKQVDDADHLLEDRVKAVPDHVVQDDPRDVPDIQRSAHPVNLFASTRGTPTDLLC